MTCFTAALILCAVVIIGAEDNRRDVTVVTSTIFTTTTLTRSTSMTYDTYKVCAVKGSTGTIQDTFGGTSTVTNTPAGPCRRKRGILPDDVFIGLPQDNLPVQFYRLTPSQVMRFESSHLPYFAPGYPIGDADIVLGSPAALQPSFGRQGPFLNGLFNFGLQFSSLVSNIVSNVITNALSLAPSSAATSASSSSRSTSTTFTTTTVTKITTGTTTMPHYTSTKSYLVAGSCYPGNIDFCLIV